MNTLAQARRFDLHLHTRRSDGDLSPEELLAHCAEAGLDVVAVTDHDLATDMAFGPQIVEGRAITVIPGAEISGVHEGTEYHLLVYFPADPPASFHAFCAERCKERAVRYDTSVARLGLDGLAPSDEVAHAGARAITRHHLARALVEAGHAHDVRDAFRRFADDAHGHVPRISLPFVDAIRIAREAGGVTSWAHPPLAALKAHLPAFVAAGLHGLEGLRPMMRAGDRYKVRKLAQQHGLFLTGGSDWHGWRWGQPGLFHVDRADLAGFLAALDAV